MTYVQRNPNPRPAVLPEYRDQDGRVWPMTEVPPLGEVTWPIRIAGFEGFPEPQPVTAPEPAPADAPAEPDKHDTPTDTATALAPVKSTKTKAAATVAAGGKEA